MYIRQVDSLAIGLDVFVLPADDPTYMREEKSPLGIVGIGAGLMEFVIDSVIPRPFCYRVLKL